MYTYERRVTYSEVGMDAAVDMARIACYFQDCSSFEGEMRGNGIAQMEEKHCTWMLVSWQIVVKRFPVYGETIRVSTWPYGFDAMLGYRNFKIEDAEGETIAYANSYWILVDTGNGHPMKIPKELVDMYHLDEKLDMEYTPRKLPFKDILTEVGTLTIPRSAIDTNHHVNNAKYIQMALEYVPESYKIHQARVEYKKAAVLGDVLKVLKLEDAKKHEIKILLADENKTPNVVIIFNGECKEA